MNQGIESETTTSSFFVPHIIAQTETQPEIIRFELKAQDEAQASAQVAKLQAQFDEKYGNDSPLKALQGESDKAKIVIEYHPRDGDATMLKAKLPEFLRNSTVGHTPELIVACVQCTLPPEVQQQRLEEAKARWRAMAAHQEQQRVLAFKTPRTQPIAGKSAGR